MNQYSRWALGAGVAQGETVALAMGNRPEYFAIWLGLTQVGAIVALVSPDLPGPALAHALKVAEARRVIVDAQGLPTPSRESERGRSNSGPTASELDQGRRLDLIVGYAMSGEPLRARRAPAKSRSLIARCGSLRRERRVCPRRRRSAIGVSSAGPIGSPA